MTARTALPFIAAFLSNFILGISSLYWHLFPKITSLELVVFRITLSFIALLFVVIFIRFAHLDKKSKIEPRFFVIHCAAGILVAINWGVFIWSSINGSVFESGLGYLIAPVWVMVIGIVFQEKSRSTAEISSTVIIAAALAWLIAINGQLQHWVYLSIGLTWGSYALLKRETSLSPINGLFLETAVLLVIIAAVFPWVDLSLPNLSIDSIKHYPWLLAAGIVSVAPLVMFAFSARQLNAFSMGALQFVLPTTQLAVSIIFYRQDISIETYACFASIWASLVYSTFSKISTKPRCP